MKAKHLLLATSLITCAAQAGDALDALFKKTIYNEEINAVLVDEDLAEHSHAIEIVMRVDRNEDFDKEAWAELIEFIADMSKERIEKTELNFEKLIKLITMGYEHVMASEDIHGALAIGIAANEDGVPNPICEYFKTQKPDFWLTLNYQQD